eukprot:TRINITY_DN72451_c0_g1_i1.p1 TRINITY_DN72451_c0_g1~~TRINITY_DN72451_c0_g1_i1.p1  ORF type:complete len:158 (-),score=43.77 TRINITY_DN72451_c0_g1_i1:123-596(-)
MTVADMDQEAPLSCPSFARKVQLEELLRDGWRNKEEELGCTHPEVIIALNNYASLLQDMRKFDDAAPIFQAVYERRMESLGASHPDTLVSLTALGKVLQAQGKNEEAEAYFRQALQSLEEALGRDSPEFVDCAEHLIELLEDQDRAAESADIRSLLE